jgi:hypothetical protein
MNVGRFEEKGSTILADTSPLCKNNQKSIGKSWNKGKPAILAEGGGSHNHEERWPPPWPPYLYKTLIESEYLTKNKQLWININRK